MFKKRSKSETRGENIIIDSDLNPILKISTATIIVDLSKGGELSKNLATNTLQSTTLSYKEAMMGENSKVYLKILIETITKNHIGNTLQSMYVPQYKVILPPPKLLRVSRPLTFEKRIKLSKSFKSIPNFECIKMYIIDFVTKRNLFQACAHSCKCQMGFIIK